MTDEDMSFWASLRGYGWTRLITSPDIVSAALLTLVVWLWSLAVPEGLALLHDIGAPTSAICGGLLGIVIAAQAIVATFAHSRFVRGLHRRGRWRSILFMFWYDGLLAVLAILAGLSLEVAGNAKTAMIGLDSLSLLVVFLLLYALFAALTLMGMVSTHALWETEVSEAETEPEPPNNA